MIAERRGIVTGWCWARVLAWVGVAAALVAAGCSSPGGALTLTSMSEPVVLSPSLPSGFYSTPDGNTADIYLTDIPLGRLMNAGDDLSGVAGSVVHIHLFLVPKAGSTPIDKTACNATVRYFVLSRGAVGLYAGGGFVQPDERPGSSLLSGDVRDVTARLVRAGPGFQDRLGIARLTGSFGAKQDSAASEGIARRLRSLQGMMKAVE